MFNRPLLFTCKNTFVYSVLHLAASHGRQQLVNQVLQLMEQEPSTRLLLIDRQDGDGWVSGLERFVLKCIITIGFGKVLNTCM